MRDLVRVSIQVMVRDRIRLMGRSECLSFRVRCRVKMTMKTGFWAKDQLTVRVRDLDQLETVSPKVTVKIGVRGKAKARVIVSHKVTCWVTVT